MYHPFKLAGDIQSAREIDAHTERTWWSLINRNLGLWVEFPNALESLTIQCFLKRFLLEGTISSMEAGRLSIKRGVQILLSLFTLEEVNSLIAEDIPSFLSAAFYIDIGIKPGLQVEVVRTWALNAFLESLVINQYPSNPNAVFIEKAARIGLKLPEDYNIQNSPSYTPSTIH